MVIQCGCLDMMRAEDGKLHSQLEWPYIDHTLVSVIAKNLPNMTKTQNGLVNRLSQIVWKASCITVLLLF